MPAKVTVRVKDGTTFEHEVQDYPGMPSRPFTRNDAAEKFDQLTADRIDSDRANEIKDAVHSLEHPGQGPDGAARALTSPDRHRRRR
jgi:2-methylcitrate dehydratase